MHAKFNHGSTFGAHCFAAFLLAVSLGGCAYTPPDAPPSVTLEIGGDQFPMNPPAPQGMAMPPPGTALTAPPLNLAGDNGPLPMPGGYGGPPQSGQYAGVGNATNDPLGECQSPIRLTNWVVTGSSVRFGAFVGTIQPDGTLAMQARNTYIHGRFTGSRFQGTVWQGVGVGCHYSISVQPL